MTDTIDTDAMREHAQAVKNHIDEMGQPGPEVLVMADLLLMSETIVRLCDEMDRLRAARELSDDEALIVENARTRFDGEHRVQMAWGEFLGAELLAVIDRLTDGAAP